MEGAALREEVRGVGRRQEEIALGQVEHQVLAELDGGRPRLPRERLRVAGRGARRGRARVARGGVVAGAREATRERDER